MSEPEVEAKPVSLVGLIEAYETSGWASKAGKGLFDWLTQHEDCYISHRGKVYMINPERDEIQVFQSVREASEIDAESGASASRTQPRTNNTT